MDGKNGSEKDIADLVTRSLAAEASEAVFGLLEKAFDGLDADSQRVLRDFFSGKTVAHLAEEHRIDVASMTAWLAQAKRSLVQELRALRQTKQ